MKVVTRSWHSCYGKYMTRNAHQAFDIKGVLAPVFTPMYDDGSLNLDIIPEYAEYLQHEGVNGILVGGTTGEHSVLNLRERKSLLAAWIEAACPRGLRVISQVGAEPMPDILDLAQYSQELGADAVLTLPELYFKPRTVDQLVTFLEAVGKAAPELPLLYYHFPMMSGVDVNMKQFFTAATERIPTFKGMKADLGVAMQLTDLLEPDQRIFMANHHLAPAALMGYSSSIATVSNMFPRLVLNILTDMEHGDLEAARERQERLNRIVDAVNSTGDFLPAMKATMEFVTDLKVGPTRMPVPTISDSGKIKLEQLLRDLDAM